MIVSVRIALASLWLIFAAPILAQPIFSLPFINQAAPGLTINLPVTVSGFNNIVSAQFVIRWNPTVLQYLGVDHYGLPNIDVDAFGTVQTLDSGILRFRWLTNQVQVGTTVPDNTPIFRLRLKVLGAINESSSVIITQAVPTYFEVVELIDGINVVYPDTAITVNQGFVAIGYTVGTDDPTVHSPFQVTIAPNPSSATALISFELSEPTAVHYTITDHLGRVVLEQVKTFPSGINGIEIGNAQIPLKGNYFLTLRTAHQQSTQPFTRL